MRKWGHRKKVSVILCQIMMCCLLLEGCDMPDMGRYMSNAPADRINFWGSVGHTMLKTYIHEILKKLQELGIDAIEAEEDIVNQLLIRPEEVLEAMEPEWILGTILSLIGSGFFPGTEEAAKEIYAFDMEMPEIVQMYTDFFEGIVRIAGGDLEITDIEEEMSEEVLEAGEGTKTVRFCCNGKVYEYEAQHYYDWFDTGMLAFMNQVLEDQKTDSRLYVTGDGGQDCIVLYRTEEWAEQFRQLFSMGLERP